MAFFDGTDTWLADGFHRKPVAQLAGFDRMEVELRQGTWPLRALTGLAYPDPGLSFGSWYAGMRKLNQHPCPNTLSHQITPPSSSTSSLATARPQPVEGSPRRGWCELYPPLEQPGLIGRAQARALVLDLTQPPASIAPYPDAVLLARLRKLDRVRHEIVDHGRDHDPIGPHRRKAGGGVELHDQFQDPDSYPGK